MLYLTYGIFAGFGHIMIYNSCFLAVLQYFAKWRSLAVSIVASGSSLGMLAMSQLTQALLSAFDWQWTVRGFSGLYFVCGLCSTLFVPLENQGETRKSDDMNKEEDRAPPLYRNISFITFLISITILLMVNFVPHVHIVSWDRLHFVHFISCTLPPTQGVTCYHDSLIFFDFISCSLICFMLKFP